jgi:hypothetical protein
MVVPSSPYLASLAPRLRQAILVLAALFVAHDAIYLARYGLGDGYARAMSAGGHHAYWLPVSMLITLGVAIIAIAAIGAYRRLRRAAPTTGSDAEPGPSYVAEAADVWIRLFPAVAILFAVQENLEHLAADGHLVGVAPLVGPGSAIVLPVLAVTTFVLAAMGAGVRWRVRVLQARLAAAIRQRFERIRATVRPACWDVVAATVAHGRIIDRRDAGRAPPQDLQPAVVTTA